MQYMNYIYYLPGTKGTLWRRTTTMRTATSTCLGLCFPFPVLLLLLRVNRKGSVQRIRFSVSLQLCLCWPDPSTCWRMLFMLALVGYVGLWMAGGGGHERQKELESCCGDAWKISCTRVRFIKLHATIERTIFQHRTRSPCLSCPFARTLWWGWIKRHYLGLIHNIIIIITIYLHSFFYARHKMRATFNQLIRGMRVIRMRYSAFIYLAIYQRH